jgi:hypothetical protein
MDIQFPPKTVSRYVKVQAMAQNVGATDAERCAFSARIDKIEASNPGIGAFVQSQFAAVLATEAAEDYIRKTTGQEPMKDPGPKASFVDKALYNVYKWGLGHLVDQMGDEPDDSTVDESTDQWTPEKRTKRKNKNDKGGLIALFYDRIGVGDASVSADDAGEYIHLDMDIPVEVWDKIMSTKTGSARFCEWIEDVTEGD